MVWAKAALVGGLLVLLVTFGVGTEQHRSTVIAGQIQDCGAPISAAWLVSGTPDLRPDGCGSVIQQSRVLLGSAMAAGALLALVGWAASPTRPDPSRDRPVRQAPTLPA